MRNPFIAVGVVVAVLVLGACGSEMDRKDPGTSVGPQRNGGTTTTQAPKPAGDTAVFQAPWTIKGKGPGEPGQVALSPDTRRFQITVSGGSCLPQAPPRFGHVRVDENSSVVVVAAYLRQEKFHGKSCAGVGYEARGTVALHAPLGARSIVDSSETPAIIRWPGPSVIECFHREKDQFREVPAKTAQTVSALINGINSLDFGTDFDRICPP